VLPVMALYTTVNTTSSVIPVMVPSNQQPGSRFGWRSAILFSWRWCSCSAATPHRSLAQQRLKLGLEARHWGWLRWAPLAWAPFAVPT
jgi:hypothetical protein